MINFKVVEVNDDELYGLADEFARVYNNPRMKVHRTKEKLDLSIPKYNRLRRYCIEEGLIKSRVAEPPHIKKPRVVTNICEVKGSKKPYFKIYKYCEYYASTDTYEKAVMIRDELEKVNWDKSKVEEIKKNVENRWK